MKRLINLFTYIDAMIVDSPIVDPRVRQEIHDSRMLEDRLVRADVFRRYLDGAWIHVSESQPSLEWPELSRELERDMERVARRAK